MKKLHIFIFKKISRFFQRFFKFLNFIEFFAEILSKLLEHIGMETQGNHESNENREFFEKFHEF